MDYFYTEIITIMKCLLLTIFIFIFYSEWNFANAQLEGSTNIPSAVKSAEEAIFVIATKRNMQTGGSGFFFENTHTFVTAFHVIETLLIQQYLSKEDTVKHLVLVKDGHIQEHVRFTGIKNCLYYLIKLYSQWKAITALF